MFARTADMLIIRKVNGDVHGDGKIYINIYIKLIQI